jgi:hypothetical protein
MDVNKAKLASKSSLPGRWGRVVLSESLTMPDPEQSFSQSQKITVSLFAADHAKLSALQLALAKRGRHVSASHAVRLALRSLPVTDGGDVEDKTGAALVDMLDAMSDEDGRSKRFSWGPAPKVAPEPDKLSEKTPKTGKARKERKASASGALRK